MTLEEATQWLKQVDGQLYRRPRPGHKEDMWIAVVHTPGIGGPHGRLIIALGETLQEAASVAEVRWQQFWDTLPASH